MFEERLIGEFTELLLGLILRVARKIWEIWRISAGISRILQILPGSANSKLKFHSKKLARVCSQKILQFKAGVLEADEAEVAVTGRHFYDPDVGSGGGGVGFAVAAGAHAGVWGVGGLDGAGLAGWVHWELVFREKIVIKWGRDLNWSFWEGGFWV